MPSIKIALVHPFIEGPGGAVNVALNMAVALRGFGYDVTLHLFRHLSDVNKVCNAFRLNCDSIRIEKISCPLTIRFFEFITKRRALRAWISIMYIKRQLEYINKLKDRYDLVIHTDAHVPYPIDVIYTHYPYFWAPIYSSSTPRRLYNIVTEAMIEHLLHKLSKSNPLILTNSFWTASVVKKAWKRNAEVLHPPVDIDYFGEVFNNDRREKIVVTISRIAIEKRLDIIPVIANILRNYKFFIVGARTPTSDIVLNRITSECRRLGCDNVEVVLNPSREEIRSLLGEAMFYLHPPFPEHFGIAIAEAIAAGAIPIVYRDGGGWTDIVSRISSELGYRDISEVSMIIRRLENNGSKLYELRKIGRDVVNDFRPERFRENLRRIIEGLLHDSSRGRTWQRSLQV